MSIVIYRASDAKAPRSTKAERAEADERLAIARVSRDAVADLFISGAFYRLPVIEPAERTTPALRAHRGTAAAKGFIVPAEDLGRNHREDQSVANSIRLWITKNLSPYVRPTDLTVVYEPDA